MAGKCVHQRSPALSTLLSHSVRRMLALSFGILVLLFATSIVHAVSDQDQVSAEKRKYSDSVVRTYQDRYKAGSHFLPSNLTTEDGDFIDPGRFPTAQYCGHCHGESHAQWRESAHSNANRAPWYLRNVELLKADKGVEATRHCEGCHDPVAVVAGNLTSG
ncbi:MAG: hypothetical protein ACRYFU_02460, partial [Janthinobacterium lividum]